MSDAPINDGMETDPGSVVDGETIEQVEQFETPSEEPSRQYLEVEDPDQRYVRVRVDGEEVEVPFSEALRGYSREADYTRKTQSLAEQRQQAEYGMRLQQAMDANPQATLALLAQQHGLTLTAAQQAAMEPEPEFSDPLEKMLYEERQARIALEERVAQREMDEQLNRVVTGLRTEFNANDEDVRATITAAMKMGLGVEALPMVYKNIAYDRFAQTLAAHRAQQAAQEAETQRRTQAKAQASSVVSVGTGAGNGLTDRLDTDRPMTIRDALNAAFEAAERG